MDQVQPNAQGVYSCVAANAVSNQTANSSAELLVYYVPDGHPECMWVPSVNYSHVQLVCSWSGAYPAPELRWRDEAQDPAQDPAQVADSLSLTLNASLLSDGQTVRCTGRHQLLGPGEERTCSFTFRSPYPEGEPLATALEATSVTLTCREVSSVPPADTTWRRGQQQDVIVPGSKYVLSEDGPALKLTILNVSQDDQGVYFCRSQNALAVRELEVYLTVKTSSAYTGAAIGLFIAALIAALAVVVAKTLYASRHRICLGGGFEQIEEDRAEVLSLVDSDDEQLFQDAVPQLPPVTPDPQTTLVQIHRIPSSDHEDAETAEASWQQLEDTEQTDEPEDLVTF
ncbi:V-set and immunoglobulin domain-containing protein 10 isoform X2 [Cololabis saira]|nr:V-set and immunoglobulin domain-containing protein 10 isoform X2 [Cololabis saira]